MSMTAYVYSSVVTRVSLSLSPSCLLSLRSLARKRDDEWSGERRRRVMTMRESGK